MRPRPSTFSSALLLGCLAAAPAHGQACCAGTSLLAPARLTPHEDALVALEARVGNELGSLDGRGAFHGNASTSGGLDLAQTLLGTLRVLREGQVTLLVPLVEGVRWAPGLSESGVGLGDVSLSFRYDFVLAGASVRVPGLALLVGLTFPTGRSAESARLPLGSDATGAGVWQAGVGLGVEQTIGHLFLQASVLGQQSLPRTARGVTELLGPTVSLGLSAGWAFDSGAAVAFSSTTAVAVPAWVDSVWAPDTGRVKTSLSVGGAMPLSEAWRLQGSLAVQLPVGLNETVSGTLSVLLMRTWT